MVSPVSSFELAAAEVFEPFLKEYGFARVSTIVHKPECVVKYWNRTSGIHIDYEAASSLMVDLVQLERTEEETVDNRSYDLSLLMELRHPDIDRTQSYGSDKNWSDEYFKKLLQKYAAFLKEEAHDVLTGDFTIFPELKKLSAHCWRQKNKEYFGTYIGESPRFSTRPTLAQVFAGAKEIDLELERLSGLTQNKTQWRIYEAYWDHQYSIRQIADFLNQTESSIEKELDDYDDR
jgi:hypothetical protein